MIEGQDYKVYLVKLPSTVYGAVRVDRDGFYSVYINDGLPDDMQRHVMDHEMVHMERGDFENGLTIGEAENMKSITWKDTGVCGRRMRSMSDDLWLKWAVMMQKLVESNVEVPHETEDAIL